VGVQYHECVLLPVLDYEKEFHKRSLIKDFRITQNFEQSHLLTLILT